jgi:CheY-like chemotaxis protein
MSCCCLVAEVGARCIGKGPCLHKISSPLDSPAGLGNDQMKTILLAEDSEDDVFFFKRALERKGIKNPLQIVSDGKAAIDYLSGKGDYADRKKHPLPDLIFLDIQMPKHNGHEVINWLRNQTHLPYLPVVMLSSSSEQKDLNAAYRLGTNAYLVKTGDPQLLATMLEQTTRFWFEVNTSPPSSDDPAKF